MNEPSVRGAAPRSKNPSKIQQRRGIKKPGIVFTIPEI